MSQTYADIIIDISHSAIDRVFQYRIGDAWKEQVQVGSLVTVPFGEGNAHRHGYVIGITQTPSYEPDKIKEIVDVPQKGLPIEGKLIQLAAWMRETYGTTMNQALQTVMPVKQTVRKTAQKVEETTLPDTNWEFVTLNDEQQALVDAFAEDIQAGERHTYLLHGVTGSGKTEVYIQCIKEVIREGGQAIVLIPEIALTYQTVMRFFARFGNRVSIINSRLSNGERYDQFERAKNGDIDIMIGPRSALFTPFSNLGLIIIDEEHENSYKSESVPRYHAREVAIEYARMSDAIVVLGSATPSVDSYYKAKTGVYRLLELDKRVDDRPLPKCEVVDLRQELREGNRSILSTRLQELMEERLLNGQQTMLFLNRRGKSAFMSCRACGFVVKCPHCDVSLSEHSGGVMVCHYCGYRQPVPKVCPSCGSKYISGFKAGTQKIEAMVAKRFPQARILRMDYDTTRAKDAYEKILQAFSNHEADILIGTQMIVKGHDFSNVTLVGVLAADMSLHVNDFHAAERTFALLTQAAGRAGRGKLPGNVVIQTYDPDHYAIRTAKEQDYEAFYDKEIEYRRLMNYPPVWNMLLVHVTSPDESECGSMAQRVYDIAAQMISHTDENHSPDDRHRIQLIGPADATIAKVNDIYRKVIYMKTSDYAALISIKDGIEQAVKADTAMKNANISFDFNPMSGF